MVNVSPSCLLDFLQAGGSCFSFCVAGNSSWVEKAEGLSERRDDVLVRFKGWDLSADCDLGMGN